mgnify:FL=1
MKAIFIYNPESGSGRIRRNISYIKKKLESKYSLVDIYESKSKEDLIKKASMTSNYDALIFSGGDGTFNDIITGISKLEKKPVLGYLPSGTANDIGKNLNLSKNYKKALKIILNGNVTEHDVGLINDDHYFMYVVASGTFSSVSYRTKRETKKSLGKLAYLLDGLKDLFNPEIVDFKLKLEGHEGEYNAPLVLVLNSKSVGGIKFNYKGHRNDGYFDILIFKKGKGKNKGLVNIFSGFLSGIFQRKLKKRNVISLRANELTLEASDNITWCIDGEEGIKGTITIKNLHKYIQIYTPKNWKIIRNIV